MTTVYTNSDRCALNWLGDRFEKAYQPKNSWGKILGHMSASLDPNALRDLLVDQLSQPIEFESEV